MEKKIIYKDLDIRYDIDGEPTDVVIRIIKEKTKYLKDLGFSEIILDIGVETCYDDSSAYVKLIGSREETDEELKRREEIIAKRKQINERAEYEKWVELNKKFGGK